MKKFFEKNDIVKMLLVVLLVVVICSWIMPASYFESGSLVTDEIQRVGIFDIATYGSLGFYYFPTIFVFIFAVGMFYKILGSTRAYDTLTTNIANKLKGKEKIFVGINILVYGLLANVVSEHLVFLMLIPFTISILAKLKVNKVSALAATFGGVLLGVLSNTYSSNIVGYLADAEAGLGVAYGYEFLSHLILFIISYLLLTFLTFKKMDDTKAEEVKDMFISEQKPTDKKIIVKTLGLGIILGFVFVVSILAFIGWDTVFGINFFADLHEKITTATIGDHTIFYYLLGSTGNTPTFHAFGSWDLFGLLALMMIGVGLVKFVYRISLNKIIDSAKDGAIKICKPLGVVFMCYAILAIALTFPTVSYVINWILGLGSNIFTQLISSIIGGLMIPDFHYNTLNIASAFSTASNVNTAAMAYQFGYGIVSFIAPTSVILVAGLSMLDIKFKDYFKFIWKFLVAIIVVVIVILIIA